MYLDADSLEGGNAPHLQGLAAKQVGRPHDGHVLRRHPRVVVVGRHPEQVTRQVLQCSRNRNNEKEVKGIVAFFVQLLAKRLTRFKQKGNNL
jgi:hypothetical protein